MSRARLIFIVFYLSAVLIVTVHLRVASSQSFNRCRSAMVNQTRLKQQLWQKQLQLESLMNPREVYKHIDRDNKK